MNKVYSRIIWKNYPNTSTAINETNLNRMDKAIDDLDNRVIEQDSTKANQTTVNNMVKNWTMDETTGVITVEKQDGSKIMFDLNIEKIPVTFELSPSGILTMTTSDGTQFTANIGAMIPVLTFNESDQIAVSVSGSGVNKTYSFSIKDNSITENKLQPNFLADIKVQSANASLSANNAETSATQAQSYAIGGTGTRENEDTDNAMYYYEQAKQTDIGQISSKVDEINSKLSKQLGNHTVKSDVPENAVFTDTVYDYSALLGYDIYNLVSLKDATYPANKTWLSKDFIAPFDGHIFFMVQTDATSGAFTQVLREDDVLVSNNQRNIADFNTWGEVYNHSIYKGKTYHFRSYNNTATSFNKVMLCIRKKFEIPTEYVPYAPSNVELAEEKADKTETTVNLLKPTLETTTKNGVTCTNNGDGTYTLNGTASADGQFVLARSISSDGVVKLVGCPKKGTDTSYYLRITSNGNDYGDGYISLSSISNNDITLAIKQGFSFNNLVFKPMITTNLDATYDDFVPYTGDTGKINSDVASLLKRIETLESLVNKTDATTTVTE